MHRLELINGYPQYSFKNIYLNKEKVIRGNTKLKKDKWSTLRVINNPRGRASLHVNSEVPNELFYSSPGRLDKPSTEVFGSSRIFLGGVDPYRTRNIQKTFLPFVGSIGRLKLNGKFVDLKNQRKNKGAKLFEEQKSSLEQKINECSREPCKNGGKCFLDRWGVFQCQCQHGFTGRFCTLPSMDGVCPEDGRRWCYRGVCLWEDGKATCLCPPGLLGEQCELENKQFDEEINNIEFNGKNSLLAFSLNSTENEGEIDENNGFLVEFRLNPTQTSFDEEQLLALLMREKDSQVLAAVTMLPQNGKLSKWSDLSLFGKKNSQLGDIIQKCLAIAPSYAFTFLQYSLLIYTEYQQIQ